MSDRALQGSTVIRFEGVSKSYDAGQTFVVRNASFEVESGAILVMLGSSGSGKTTLLRMINGLVSPTEGTVSVRGKSGGDLQTYQSRRLIGYVSQGIALFPFMRVWENISLPLKLLGIGSTERRRRSEEFMSVVDLPIDWADRLPMELSGGQQQRVALARALITGTDILLMDEPFGALDAIIRDTLQAELLKLRAKLGVTIVFVTHDLFEALALADQIVVLHQGIIEQIGKPEDMLHHPQTEFVSELFERPARLLGRGTGE